MSKIAVIGAGISGLTVAQLLKEECEVVFFEKDSKAGGLIKCESIRGSLFHHVADMFSIRRIKMC